MISSEIEFDGGTKTDLTVKSNSMLQSEVSYDTLIKLKVTDSIIQRYLLSINDFTLEESLQSYIGNISITFSKRSYIFQ